MSAAAVVFLTSDIQVDPPRLSPDPVRCAACQVEKGKYVPNQYESLQVMLSNFQITSQEWAT